MLRRRDRERRDDPAMEASEFDWADLNGAASKLTLRALRKWQTIDNPLRHAVPNYRVWRVYRDALISKAVAQFRPYRLIDTDRLHGVILGALMSKQIRYRESSYGKLHRYIDLWLRESPLIQAAVKQQAAG